MAGYHMHSSHVGTVRPTRLHKHNLAVKQSPIRHQPGVAIHSLSRRTCTTSARRERLHILAASSTDIQRQGSEATRSAQDLAQGVQDFLDESQKAFSSDEAPLPEHPVGEEGKIDVTESLDASVSTAEMVASVDCSVANETI